MKRKYKDGEPCEHKGCLHHITQPCELCGRIAGRKINKDEISKELCELLGIEYKPAKHIQVEFFDEDGRDRWEFEEGTTFTTDSGKISLLREMEKIKKIRPFIIKTCGLGLEDLYFVNWIPISFLTDENFAFAIAARDFLRREK